MCVAGQSDSTQSSDYSKLSPDGMTGSDSENVFTGGGGGGGGGDSSFDLDPASKQQQQQLEQEVMERDQGSGFVVLGAFVAGSLVGIIICAPVFVVLLFGAGAAALTNSDSKAGKFSRKVGKFSSDILIAVTKMARQFNKTHQVTHRASETAKQGVARVRSEVQKRDQGNRMKAGASAMWTSFKERTAPSPQEELFEDPSAFDSSAPVTDGTQLPFGGAAAGGRQEENGAPKIFHT